MQCLGGTRKEAPFFFARGGRGRNFGGELGLVIGWSAPEAKIPPKSALLCE